MNWNQLQYVITITEEKNMTRAAQALFISQPSLSISIKQLEAELGAKLFTRESGKLELTYAGELFYDWAKMVALSQKRMEDCFAELRGAQREKICIGISPHRSTVVTPRLMKLIHDRYPACEVILVEKPTNELEELLDTDKLDMIIDVPGRNSMIYHYEEITDEGMCLAVPKSFTVRHPFDRTDVTDGQIELKELSDYDFIMLPERSYFGKVSRKSLEIAGIVPKIICECTLSETVQSLVDEQLGIALLPDSFLSAALISERIRYYRIKGDRFRRKIGIVYKNERYHSKLFMELVDIVREVFIEIYNDNNGES